MAPTKTAVQKSQAADGTAADGLVDLNNLSLTDKLQDRQAIPELSWDNLLKELGGVDELDDASDLGGGFHLIKRDDKTKLEGVPFVILYFRINDKWRYGPGVSMMIQTAVPIVIDGNRYERLVVNDGSTGIAQQLFDYHEAKKKNGPILIRQGLRSSEYEVTEDDPENPGQKRAVIDPATSKPVIGKTFYLNTTL